MATDPVETSQREQQLDEVLGTYLEAVDRGEAPDRQGLLDLHPELEPELSEFFSNHDQIRNLTEQLCPALQAAIDVHLPGPALSVVSPDDFPSDADTSCPGSKPRTPEPPAQPNLNLGSLASNLSGFGVLHPLTIDRNFGDFELLAPIGRGGMGMVFKARQASLQRLVALKMIVAGRLASEADVQRFHNEAEAAAHLDHPHIVPIYAVGQCQGYHYFSMRLIEGGDLAHRLDDFRADPRAAVILLAAVAGAVHHAHQRGILHRDLKPSNILLDAFGQPLVSDFGLAKRCEAGPEDSTLSGEPLGTPPYMAPEQATGSKAEITTATDVYGLGALLYALLTGGPPFRADTMMATLELVKHRTPTAPLTGTSSAARDLNTICLKCLEKDPKGRYGSAQQVAVELERWLAGEPIVARPIGRAARLWRLCRRYPLVAGLSATAALLLVIAVAVLGFSNAAILREKVRTEGAYEKARAISEEYRSVIDSMYTRVAEERLFDQPHMEELQRDLLVDALRAYQRVINDADPDPTMRREVALAHRRVGEIQLLLGQHAEAETASRHAIQLLSVLADERPFLLPPKQDLASAHRALGRVLAARNRDDAAENALRSALAIEQSLVATAPANPGYRQGLARTLNILAHLVETTGRTQEAEAAYRKALELYGKLTAEFPAEPDYLNQEGGTLNNLALLLQAEGKLEEARRRLDQAIEKQTVALTSRREHPEYRQFLSNHNANLVEVLAQMGLISQAKEAYAKVIKLHEELAAEHHSVPTYRKLVAADHRNVGRLFEMAGQLDKAESSLQKARTLGQELVHDFPAAEHDHELAITLTSLGRLLESLGRYGEADTALREAVALGKRLVSEDSKVPDYQLSLAASQVAFGHLLQTDGRFEEAERFYKEAVAQIVPLSNSFPTRPDYRHVLASSHLTLGSLLRTAGNLKEAERFDRAALAALEKLAAEAPDRPGYRHDLASVYDDLGDFYRVSGRAAEAEKEYNKALGLQQELVTYFHDVPHYRYDLAQTYCNLGRLVRPGEQRAEKEARLRGAIDLLEELVDRVPEISPYRQALVGAYLQLGLRLFDEKRYNEAENALRHVVELGATLVDASPPRPDDRSVQAAALDGLASILGSRYRDGNREPNMLEQAKQLSFQAITQQSTALQVNPHNPTYREHLVIQYTNLARTLLLLREHTEVAARAGELATALTDSPDALASAARMLCASLAPIESDSKLASDHRTKLVRASIEQAAAYLRQAESLLGTPPPGGSTHGSARMRLAEGLNGLAWFLATCQETSLRDPERATILARKACDFAPGVPQILGTLGTAYYRTGEWAAAVEALEKAQRQSRELDPSDGFALAMAHWQLGHNDEARGWFDKATSRMLATHATDATLKRLKAEAESLIAPPAVPEVLP